MIYVQNRMRVNVRAKMALPRCRLSRVDERAVAREEVPDIRLDSFLAVRSVSILHRPSFTSALESSHRPSHTCLVTYTRTHR